MSTVELLRKLCSTCREDKPASEFYRDPTTRDGLRCQCKPCARASARASQQRRRAEIGDDAFRAEKRLATALYRARKPERTRLYGTAANRATRQLIELHRSEYDALLRRHLYELESGQS